MHSTTRGALPRAPPPPSLMISRCPAAPEPSTSRPRKVEGGSSPEVFCCCCTTADWQRSLPFLMRRPRRRPSAHARRMRTSPLLAAAFGVPAGVALIVVKETARASPPACGTSHTKTYPQKPTRVLLVLGQRVL